MIGDDREHFGGGTTELAALLALAPEQMREIGCGLEVPALAALHQADTAIGIMVRQFAQARTDLAQRRVSEKTRQRLRAHRLLGSEQRRLHPAHQIVHAHARMRRRRSGPKTSSCASSARPIFASSSAATKLEASAERRSRGSA